MKFIKTFAGVKSGDIYPTQFAVGDECPPELVDAAKAEGAVASVETPAPKGKSK